MTGIKIALAVTLSVGGLFQLIGVAHAQDQRIVMKGGETIEMYSVWYVNGCKSRITAAPTVEVLDGPPQIKLWVEPAMVVASRLKCTTSIPGGKLMVTAGTVEQPAEAKITFRVIYQTPQGVRQVGRVYPVSLFPGRAGADQKAEPSRSWKQFIASVGGSSARSSDSRIGTRQQQRRRYSRKAAATRVANLSPPAGASRETVYAYCRRAVFRKYGWKGHDGKIYMHQRPSFAMIDHCANVGGKVP